MITAKIYKVKEVTQHNGEKYYYVVGYDNKLEYFLNAPSFTGAKQNKTFMEALEQIDTLINCCAVSDKTIHVVFSKNVKTSAKESHPVQTH